MAYDVALEGNFQKIVKNSQNIGKLKKNKNPLDFEYSGRVFYERDWNLTCAYFATGCFSSILLWTILEKRKTPDL